MPHDKYEPDDPMMLVGVGLPGGPESSRDMAYTFAEEFARMGYGEQDLLRLFQDPFYQSAHSAFELLGEKAIIEIVGECVGVWETVHRAGGAQSGAEPVGRSCPGLTARRS